MSRNKKNKSVVVTLLDREINSKYDPSFLSLKAISSIIRSDATLYTNYWQKSSKRPITYDSGYLYFNDYTSCFSLYGKYSMPTPLFKLQKSSAQKKISDMLAYSVPVYRTLDTCKCSLQRCVCLSQSLLSISEDNWLCQYSMTTGRLLKEFYVNRYGKKFSFKYCDWDVYGERFVLTSTLNPDMPRHTYKKYDAVVNIAVFTLFPFEFFTLFEIKRSVFGESCIAANISDQHLILGLGNSLVNIYSFLDFINQGNLKPYKFGEDFADGGKIGSFPTGLPLNFTYSDAPPLLFKVQGFGQIIRFGGYPFHYITASAKNSRLFTVTNIETNISAINGPIESNSFNDDIDALTFHPDHSNRLLFKDSKAVYCYGLIYNDGVTKLKELFSMGFSAPETIDRSISSFGRRITQRANSSSEFACSIYSTDYASDLDLFAILGVQSGNTPSAGFVRMYDSVTGKDVRTLQLKEKISECNMYELYVDMGSIVIIERKDRLIFTVYVYNI